MIFDKALLAADKLAMSGLTVTTNELTNTFDQLAAGDAVNPLRIHISVDTTCGSTGSATCQFLLLTSSVSTFTTATTTTHTLTDAIPVATMAAGYVAYTGRMPANMKRYYKIQAVVGTAAFNAGKITAGFIVDEQTSRQQ